MTEASSHVVHLTGRLRELETLLSERQSRENKLLKDSEENKSHYREAKRENSHLKGMRASLQDLDALLKKWTIIFMLADFPCTFLINHFA